MDFSLIFETMSMQFASKFRSLSSVTLRSTTKFGKSSVIPLNSVSNGQLLGIRSQLRLFTNDNKNKDQIQNETFSKIPKMSQEDVLEVSIQTTSVFTPRKSRRKKMIDQNL